MRTKLSTWAPGVGVLVAALAGCASHTPVLDSKFGAALSSAMVAQTIDADAGRKAAPVIGIDGDAAASSMERYKATFKSPPAPVNVFNIGVGSSTGGR